MAYKNLPVGTIILPNGDIQIPMGNLGIPSYGLSVRLKSQNNQSAGLPITNYLPFTPALSSVLVPTTSDYWNNSGIARPSSGKTIHAALSKLKVNLNGATSITLSSFNTGSGNIAIYDNDTYVTSINPGGDNTISSLSGGILTVVMGSEQRSYEEGEVAGCDISKFTFPTGNKGYFITPQQAITAIVVIGDSISNGSGSTNAQQKGWTSLLRNGLVRTTYVTGYGSSQGFVIGAQANWSNLKSQISAALDGATNKIIIWALGSNDAMGAHGPGACSLANYMVSFNNFVSNVQQDFADVNKLIFTPILRRGEDTINNGFGWKMAELRTAEINAVAGKANFSVLDGYSICADADISGDGAHPFDSGHNKIFIAVRDKVNTILNLTEYVPPVVTPQPVTPASNAIVWTANNGGAIGTNIIYSTGGDRSGSTWGSGFNSTPIFVYPTTDTGSVTLDVPSQVINRSLGTSGGTIFGFTNETQDGNYMTIRNSFYFDGIYVRVFELGVMKYQAALPDGLVSFSIKLTKNAITYLVNGSPISLNIDTPLGIPSGNFWVAASLSTVGSEAGDASHVSNATLTIVA